MKPQILYYGLEKEEETLLHSLGGDWTLVAPNEEDIQEKVGYLVGLDGFTREDLPEIPLPESPKILLFVNPNRDHLYQLLAKAKEKGYLFPYKAVMTDTTKNWQFSYLLNHIQEEHNMVQAYRKLGALVKIAREKCKEHPLDSLEKEIQRAKDLPKLGEDLTTEIVEECYTKIESLLKEIE